VGSSCLHQQLVGRRHRNLHDVRRRCDDIGLAANRPRSGAGAAVGELKAWSSQPFEMPGDLLGDVLPRRTRRSNDQQAVHSHRVAVRAIPNAGTISPPIRIFVSAGTPPFAAPSAECYPEGFEALGDDPVPDPQ
jgi:hypothetical protein